MGLGEWSDVLLDLDRFSFGKFKYGGRSMDPNSSLPRAAGPGVVERRVGRGKCCRFNSERGGKPGDAGFAGRRAA